MSTNEFQQSLIIHYDALIRSRTKEKRDIVKRIYLYGFISTEDRNKFELERFYQVANEISVQAIEHLIFVQKEILPIKTDDIKAQVLAVPKHAYRPEQDDELWYGLYWSQNPISKYIQDWQRENFHIGGRIPKQTEPSPTTNENPQWRQWAETWNLKGRNQGYIFYELAAELESLGIFQVRTGGGYELTKFGQKFLSFLPSIAE